LQEPTLVKKRRPSLERSAIRLALTETREAEDKLKKFLLEAYDMRSGVTELGGTETNLLPTGKLTNSVMATAFNTGVIPKDARKIHALVHATLEATNSIFIHNNSNASYILKIGLTTDTEWIAVAIYARSSLHPLLEHARVGLGFMHL